MTRRRRLYKIGTQTFQRRGSRIPVTYELAGCLRRGLFLVAILANTLATSRKRGTMKITKTRQRAVIKDIKRQLKLIEWVITDGNQDWIDQYANQLSATAARLHSEVMEEE